MLNPCEVRSLAPIAVVMLPEVRALCDGAAFERKAGSPFPNVLQFRY